MLPLQRAYSVLVIECITTVEFFCYMPNAVIRRIVFVYAFYFLKGGEPGKKLRQYFTILDFVTMGTL